MVMEEKCANCRFWNRNESFVRFYQGRCRRYPHQRIPHMFAGWAFFAMSRQPGTEPDDWCGEYQANMKGGVRL